MPIKLLGLFLLLGGGLAYLRFFRASVSGVTGPRHRQILRERSPWRFKLALALQFAGAAICLLAGILCLVHLSLPRL